MGMCASTFHDQDVAGMAISLEQPRIQQLAPVCLSNPMQYPVHGPLTILLRQLLDLVAQAGDLRALYEVHHQQLASDQPWNTPWNLDLL